jgi:outer membrane protein, multidrug efflux system
MCDGMFARGEPAVGCPPVEVRLGAWDCPRLSEGWTPKIRQWIASTGAGRAPRLSPACLLAAFLLLTGCRVGPEYHRPAPLATQPLPATFSSPSSTNLVEWKPAQPSGPLPRTAWWDLFGNADLKRLEELASGANLDLKAAFARLEQARASVNVARADLFPQADLNPSIIRERDSFNKPADGHSARTSPTYNTFTASLEAGWELDLWGRIRRLVESARAGLAARTDDLAAMQLGIQAEVAADYFGLRALDTEYDLIERTAAAYRRSFELTATRRKGGVASDLDVAQAETQLRTAEAELPALRLERTKLVHALATLCGHAAIGFELSPEHADLPVPPNVPMSLPSQLLERRPDIAAAEQRMAAANAQVGVAQGAFYPSVRLNGLAGFQSVDAATWFDWPSRLWAAGPTLDLPLFTGGRNRARLALARASYDETVANYRQTVLTAFQDVQDQLAAQQLLKDQLEAEAAALSAAQRALEIANNRYKSGLVSYLEVAIAQGVELGHQRIVVQLQGQKLLAAVGLIKALGGGWELKLADQSGAFSH